MGFRPPDWSAPTEAARAAPSPRAPVAWALMPLSMGAGGSVAWGGAELGGVGEVKWPGAQQEGLPPGLNLANLCGFLWGPWGLPVL